MWIKRAMLPGLCLILLVLLCVQVRQVDGAMQYLVLSPQTEKAKQEDEKKGPSALSEIIRRLEGQMADRQKIYASYALTSRNEGVTLEGSRGQSASAGLVGVYGELEALPPMLPLFGRRFYGEELKEGAPVMLLDEPLAIALFRAADPLDRMVELDGKEYRVIGILRHQRSPGDHEKYAAYVPLKALDEAGFQTQALMVSARGREGAGAASQFKNDMNSWQKGGSLYDLEKEKSRALLPVWGLLVCIGIAGSIFLFRCYRRLAQGYLQDYKRRLESHFAAELLPRLIGFGVLLLAAGAALLGFCFGVMQLMLSIVYRFPEWVPAVLVEWKDIVFTFWQSREAANGLIALRSPEVNALHFWGALLSAVSAALGLIGCRYGGRIEGRKMKSKN